VPDCIFCEIAAGRVPCRKVFEDEQVLAFEDLAPQAPQHVLVIPKIHLRSLNDVEAGAHADLLGHLFEVAAEVARARGISKSGYRCVVNTEAGAGQSVWHLHLHVLGGRPLAWPPG
jgi:histidine triad (HIT) family protein